MHRGLAHLQVLSGLAQNGNGVATGIIAYRAIGQVPGAIIRFGFRAIGNIAVVATDGYLDIGDRCERKKIPDPIDGAGYFALVEENEAKSVCCWPIVV